MYICKLGLSYVVHVHTTVRVNVDPSMVYNVQLNNESIYHMAENFGGKFILADWRF